MLLYNKITVFSLDPIINFFKRKYSRLAIIISGFGIYGAAVAPDSEVGKTVKKWYNVSLESK